MVKQHSRYVKEQVIQKIIYLSSWAFEKKEQLDGVLRLPPWAFDNKVMVLNVLKPGDQRSTMQFNVVEFWASKGMGEAVRKIFKSREICDCRWYGFENTGCYGYH